MVSLYEDRYQFMTLALNVMRSSRNARRWNLSQCGMIAPGTPRLLRASCNICRGGPSQTVGPIYPGSQEGCRDRPESQEAIRIPVPSTAMSPS